MTELNSHFRKEEKNSTAIFRKGYIENCINFYFNMGVIDQ